MDMPRLELGDVGDGVHIEHPKSAESLIARLYAIRSEYNPMIGMPYCVQIIHDGIGSLIVGLGETDWVVSHASLDHDVATSLGDRTATGFIDFYFGQVSAISRKHLIPEQEAIKAIRVWVETAKLSPDVEWTYEVFWE